MDITLNRLAYKPDVTLGVMTDTATGHFICCTLEEPWKDNQQKISCIPEGVYQCEPYSSMKFENVWEITNIPNRSKVLIHSGNTTDDIEGCVLVGMSHGVLKGKDAVLRSKEALLGLRSRYVGKSFKLTIKGIK